jgi:hypothetical protein
MTRLTRALLSTALAGAIGVTVAAVPAQAIPPVGPNQSVTFTYYSSAARTVVVGEWSYGYCGEPFEWGVKTRYSSFRTINC